MEYTQTVRVCDYCGTKQVHNDKSAGGKNFASWLKVVRKFNVTLDFCSTKCAVEYFDTEKTGFVTSSGEG